MLCPEVWNFKAPRHYFEIKRSSHTKEKVPTTITNHYYNHSISIVLPNSNDILRLQNCIIDDSDYYKIKNITASQLIDKEFIEAFVKKGELTLLSVDVKIDVDNCIAITPTGHLILSLTVEDYQKLGLEGKSSFFDRKIKSRYIVTINLRDDEFTPGKKFYERVRTCLTKRFTQKFNVILAWDPPEERLCPSSIAAWFHSHQYDVSLCNEKFTTRTDHNLTIPTLERNYDLEKLFEWIGIFSLNGDIKNGATDDYVNTYTCPTPNIIIDDIAYIECTGFFTRSKVTKIFDAIINYMREEQKPIPWASLHVHGFADSPVSWNMKEHTHFTDGDNSFTILYQPNGDYIIQKSLSSNNKPRIVQ